MKIEKLFNILIVVVVVGSVFNAYFRESNEDYAKVGRHVWEAVLIFMVGLLIVTGVYYHGYLDGLKDEEKSQKKAEETESHQTKS